MIVLIRSSWRAAVVVAGLLWAAPAVLAQTEPPRGEIAAGAMFGVTVGMDCDLDGVVLADCSPHSKEWWISPAYHITERVALAARGGSPDIHMTERTLSSRRGEVIDDEVGMKSAQERLRTSHRSRNRRNTARKRAAGRP